MPAAISRLRCKSTNMSLVCCILILIYYYYVWRINFALHFFIYSWLTSGLNLGLYDCLNLSLINALKTTRNIFKMESKKYNTYRFTRRIEASRGTSYAIYEYIPRSNTIIRSGRSTRCWRRTSIFFFFKNGKKRESLIVYSLLWLL